MGGQELFPDEPPNKTVCRPKGNQLWIEIGYSTFLT